MRRALLLAAAMAAGAAAAYERPPVAFFAGGDISGYVGHDIKIGLAQDVRRSGGALSFDGRNSILRFDIPWLYPDQPLSVTYVADVVLDALPETWGALCGRSGWHNALTVDREGRIAFGIFGADGKTSCDVHSATRLRPGTAYRVAGVVDCSEDDGTRLRIYVNGVCEDSRFMPMTPRAYDRTVWLGGIGRTRDGGANRPLACTVRNFRYFYKPLSAWEQIRLPGMEIAPRPAVRLGRREVAYGSPLETDPAAGAASYSMDVEFSVAALPRANGAVAGRAGFDNSLELEPDGRLVFTLWNERGDRAVNLRSATRVSPGARVRVRCEVERHGVETIARLLVQGEDEKTDALTGRPWRGPDVFSIGGFRENSGRVRKPLAFTLHSLSIRAMGE